MADDIPPHVHPARNAFASANGMNYESFRTLDEARTRPSAMAILEYSGHDILASCPVRFIVIDETALERLFRDLTDVFRDRPRWARWPASPGNGRIYYEVPFPDENDGLGGAEIGDNLTVHTDLYDLGMSEAIADVLAGKSTRLDPEVLDRISRTRSWFAAVQSGDVEAVRGFLARGFDVEARREVAANTALAVAAGAGNVPMIRLLLDHGADPNAAGWKGRTPVTEAAIRTQPWLVRDPDPRPLEMLVDSGGRIGLRDAILLGDVDSARKACDADSSIDVSGNAAISYNDTYLMEAARRGDLTMTRFLLDRGADIEGDDDLSATALMRAAAAGHAEIVKLLLDRGADVNHDDSSDQTPLSEAATSGHREIVDLLLSRGAERCLLDAVALDDVGLVAQLLRDGADPNHVYYGHGRLVMYAVGRGGAAIVRLLLDHGADHHHQTMDEHTLLAEAAMHGHVEVARLLIERGASLDAVGRDGLTPMQLAEREGRVAVLELLKQATES